MSSGGKDAHPPRAARWLAARLVSNADREFFLGDLEETFRRDAVPRLGPSRARRWYWTQVLRSARHLRAPLDFGGLRTPRTGGDGMLQDLRYAWRTLRHRPGFATAAVLTLCLGIGANVAIFSVVNGILLRPLDYEAPERLVMLWTSQTEGKFQRGSVTGPDFFAWRERNGTFDGLAAYVTQRFVFKSEAAEGEPERYTGALVTIDFFDVLGVRPALGRTFTADEQWMGAADVAVLSHGFWQTRLGGSADVLGRTVPLGSRSYRIVGVMPAGFGFPHAGVQAWTPLPLDHPALQQAGEHLLEGVGRMRADVTLAAVRADMDRVADTLRADHPDTHEKRGVFVSPLRHEVVGGIEPTLWILQGAVAFVLLIACVNVANLLVGRAVERRHEIALRSALGAGRRRLLRQLLTEGLVLSSIGGAAGLGLAAWGTRALLALNPTPLPRERLVAIDGRVVLFTVGLCLVTGLVFGLVPAIQGFRQDVLDGIRAGGRGGGGGRNRLRHAAVALECGLALVLLIGAGLMLNSFVRLLQVDPGFESSGVLALRITVPTERYPDVGAQQDFVERTVERLEALGGVESAAVVSHLPFDGDYWRYGFRRTDWPDEPGESDRPAAAYRIVSNDYFRTMRLPLIEGRAFDERDDADAPRVLVINETMARRYFADESPLGRRLEFSFCRETPCEIVGVVGDVKHFGLEGEEDPAMYGAHAQKPAEWMNDLHIVVRTSDDPASLAVAAKAQIRSVDPDLPFDWVGTMADKVDRSLAPKRFLALLLGLFSATALMLAAVGIYGVIAYTVSRRRREIGIRMALGARAADVLRLVVAQGMGGAVVGLAAGLVAALALTRVLRGVLFGIEPTDPPTFIAVTALLLAVAFLACWLPARRGSRIDIVATLREE